MTQIWDYQTVAVHYDLSNGLPFVKCSNAEHALPDHIRELGLEGWELAGVSPGMNGNREFLMFFKRPRGQEKFPNT